MAGSLLLAVLCALPANAESSFFAYEVSPVQIARRLEMSGYELRGPLSRRGDVYVCDVIGDSGEALRLVVDAHSGRLLERFPAFMTRGWRAHDLRDEEGGPLRPPGMIALLPGRLHRPFLEPEDLPIARPHRHDQVAYGRDPLAPTVIYGDHANETPKRVEKPKPKPRAVTRPSQVVKTPPAPTPSMQSVAGPTTTSSQVVGVAPAAVPPAPTAVSPAALEAPKSLDAATSSEPSQPLEATKSQDMAKPTDVAKAPGAEKASEPVKPLDASKPSQGAKTPETPKLSEPAKPAAVAEVKTVEAKPPVVVKPDTKPASKSRPINDIPVTPLD